MTRIAVIGAGITGITTAYSLSRQGYDVTVFDRNRYAAMETSFANGGQLSASNAEVWNSWSTVLKGIKWMFRRDAPLLMNPMPSWHKYSWMAEFVMNIPNYEKNTIATTRLAIEARKHLFAVAEEEKIDFDLERRGILHIYRSREGYDHAARVNRLLAAGGLERNPVAAADIRNIEPALGGPLYGGFFTPSDSTGDIHKFTRGLADACQRRGVTMITDADVRQLTHADDGIDVEWGQITSEGEAAETEKVRFDGIVVCAGVASRKFAAQLGDRVNIYPVKGYSITINLPDNQSQKAAPWVSLLDDDAKVVTSRLGADRLRVAGTAEFNGENRDIRYDRIKPLIDWSTNLFPGMDTSSIVPWAGLRPMMPDMLPRVGPGKRSRVFYNTGHGHLGWTLSAATADMVAGHVAAALPAEGHSKPVFKIAAE
ncbi:D-amino acid dehydrogenase [Phyllobacterium phragmitis]|uniref:D-amino acid dehydrogenase n=1 Tax=Phyllobacterium phragmitis TaxID=2670329 RepID=A0A2S9ISG4_9HYPH|nr:D-amino acid dehydrogenase [Phyllobacterium phragmitis]PRD43450.1 D-amino acid dehydrogenase [Phyllobacterium phragmitis]